MRWNDHPVNPNDPLGLNTYTYKPDIQAILQSGNLYVYGMNNPVRFTDPSGNLVGVDDAIIIIAVGGAFLVALTAALLADPNFQRALNAAITQIANDIDRVAKRIGQSFEQVSERLSNLAKGKGEPKDLERGMTRAQKELFSKEIHDYKRENGMPPDHNLPWDVLVALAEYARKYAK